MYKQKKVFKRKLQVTVTLDTHNAVIVWFSILRERKHLIRLVKPSHLQGEGVWSYPNAVIYLTYANIRQNSMVY